MIPKGIPFWYPGFLRIRYHKRKWPCSFPACFRGGFVGDENACKSAEQNQPYQVSWYYSYCPAASTLRPGAAAPEKLENAALFVQLGLPSTLIRHETGGAFRFRVNGKHLRFRPHVSGYFWIRNFFISDSKISPSTRSVFKSNSPVHTHPMASGFTLEKLGLHVVQLCAAILVYCSVGDWTQFCYVIGFENSRIHLPHVIGFVADLFFPLWRADSKISEFVWAEAVSGKKTLRINKYPDTCGWGLKNGAFRKRWRHGNHVIHVTEFSLNTNPKWPLIVAFFNSSDLHFSDASSECILRFQI